MTPFRDDAEGQRYEQGFVAPNGDEALVFCDYAGPDGRRALLHVEADPALRGTGAAGRFMEALAVHAREAGTKLHPVCSYAVVWFRRHPAYGDVLA